MVKMTSPWSVLSQRRKREKRELTKEEKRNTKKGTRKGTFNMSTHIESGKMKRPYRQPLTSSKIKQDCDGRFGQCSWNNKDLESKRSPDWPLPRLTVIMHAQYFLKEPQWWRYERLLCKRISARHIRMTRWRRYDEAKASKIVSGCCTESSYHTIYVREEEAST